MRGLFSERENIFLDGGPGLFPWKNNRKDDCPAAQFLKMIVVSVTGVQVYTTQSRGRLVQCGPATVQCAIAHDKCFCLGALTYLRPICSYVQVCSPPFSIELRPRR